MYVYNLFAYQISCA